MRQEYLYFQRIFANLPYKNCASKQTFFRFFLVWIDTIAQTVTQFKLTHFPASLTFYSSIDGFKFDKFLDMNVIYTVTFFLCVDNYFLFP